MNSEELRRHYEQEGYGVVRNLIDAVRAARLRTICDEVLEQWRVRNPESGEPGGEPDATVMRHLNHSGYYGGNPSARQVLMDVIADEKVLATARSILGEEPLFRCTSYFFNPLSGGREGNWHRDSQFGNPEDEKEKDVLAKADPTGNGVQLQIALVPSEDVEYVPGSHLRWDSDAEYYVRKADGGKNNTLEMPGALRLRLAPGDAALFNPLGLHRGRYHTEPVRRTLMLTYTKSSLPVADYFSFQPWFLEPAYLDGLKPSTKSFFDSFVDTYATGWRTKLAEAASDGRRM